MFFLSEISLFDFFEIVLNVNPRTFFPSKAIAKEWPSICPDARSSIWHHLRDKCPKLVEGVQRIIRDKMNFRTSPIFVLFTRDSANARKSQTGDCAAIGRSGIWVRAMLSNGCSVSRCTPTWPWCSSPARCLQGSAYLPNCESKKYLVWKVTLTVTLNYNNQLRSSLKAHFASVSLYFFAGPQIHFKKPTHVRHPGDSQAQPHVCRSAHFWPSHWGLDEKNSPRLWHVQLRQVRRVSLSWSLPSIQRCFLRLPTSVDDEPSNNSDIVVVA